MSEITKLQLENASTDAASLEAIVNGAASPGTHTTRLGQIIKTIAKVIADVESSAVTDKFKFDSSITMADPGTGDWRGNNATLASITQFAISALSAITGNPNVRAWIASWDDTVNASRGTITIRKASAPATFVMFSINNILTDNTTWLQIPVTHIASNGTFTNGDDCYLSFNRAGTAGTGDITGPGVSTDNTLVRFDGTTGKLVQQSGVVVDDVNNISNVGTIAMSGQIASPRYDFTNGGANSYLAGTAGNGFNIFCLGVNTVYFSNGIISSAVAYTSSAGITGASITSNGNIILNSASPLLQINESDAILDEKLWRYNFNGGVHTFDAINDAYTIANTIYTINRTGNSPDYFRVVPTLQDANAKPILPVQSIKIEDIKAAGVAGGSSTAGAWTQRPFANLAQNDIPGASIPAANRISLPAGTYELDAWSIFGSANLSTGKGIFRIFNVTDSAVIGYSSSGISVVNSSGINVITQCQKIKFALAATKTIEMQYYVDVAMANNGLGYAVNMGSAVERYAELIITKIA